MLRVRRKTAPDPGRLRERLSLTQADAARICGVSTRAWQYWEAGGPIPGTAQVLLTLLHYQPGLLDLIRRIAQALPSLERAPKPRWPAKLEKSIEEGPS